MSQCSWCRTHNAQEAVPYLTGEGVDTQSPTWILTYYARHGQLAFASPGYTRYTLMLKLGGLLAQLIKDH